MPKPPYRFKPLTCAGFAGVLAAALLASGCQPQANEAASGPSSSHSTTVALNTPHLKSADNFRDIAGIDTSYKVDGGALRPKTAYRSNALELNDADFSTLNGLGIATVIDLRTPKEIEEHPDRVPDGARYVNIDVSGGATGANPNASIKMDTPEDAAKLLEQANDQFVTNPGMRERLGQVLTTIAQSDGPVVFHCTAGKDRAGWTSAILQMTAGASSDDVMANYLATNDYTKDRVEATTEKIRKAKGDQAAEANAVLLGVQKSFLQTGLDAMEKNYGGIDRYLTDGLGLTPDVVQQLRDKLVEA